ncbi:MAG: gliding motility-associated C-terminal domain-containing protein [Flavobacteriales bacterium]|jgi:gliding motility-associated-like protein|nr:gliding motility-associated C-terminal domain-containing protein [Flavobacteriales bacterium]
MRYLFIPILLSSSFISAQMYVGTDVAVADGGIIKVQGNSLHVGGNGLLENAGTVDVAHNYINNGISTGFATNTGEYIVGGNWENNNVFTADFSLVHLYNSDKLITGTSITDFYTLKLSGGSKLMTIDASAIVLDLGTDHLMTDGNVMLVNNPDPTALIYSSGYVSSREDGHLQRKTNSTATYSFPLGSDLGDFRLRPIDFIPNDNLENTFGARLANNDATIDGYDLEEKSILTGNLNPLYYHHIYHNSGSSNVDVRFYYDPAEDEVTETIANWNNEWNIEDGVSNGGANGGYESLLLANFNDFSTKPFILANQNELIYIPNAFTPNSDGANDLFTVAYDEEKLLKFAFFIFDRWGNPILEEHHPNFTWDGTSKGQKLPSDAYVWKMDYQLKGSTEIVEKIGHVFLLK